jgi:hypothetical protein
MLATVVRAISANASPVKNAWCEVISALWKVRRVILLETSASTEVGFCSQEATAVSARKILATDNNASPENHIPDHPNRSISKHQHECNGPNLTGANSLR